MKVGSIITRQLTRNEFIDLFLKAFENYNNMDVVCVVTEISECGNHNNSTQSIMFAESLDV